jgi:GGDEF domain-containing protein
MRMSPASRAGGTLPSEVSWEKLERLDWHLWVLAVLLIFVLGASLLSFMFPTVFWLRTSASSESQQGAFFGFCTLMALVLVYLLQRQAIVRRLKRQLYEAHSMVAAATREASIQSFQTLPTLNQFRDALAMEYRRASSTGTNVAVVVISTPKASLDSLGYMASVLRSLLRQEESLYRLSDKGFGLIFPGMALKSAASFATQAERLLGLPKEDMEVTISAFPEEVSTLMELEQRLRHHGTMPLWETLA